MLKDKFLKPARKSSLVVTFVLSESARLDQILSHIDGLQLRHSFFPPKRLDVKMPLQSIGRYRKSTYNSVSGHI